LEPARDFLPPRRLPLLYFGFAHLSLALALLILALASPGLVGFFYQPRLVAVVHLVTLGFLTSSILGAFFQVAPLALRSPLPARRLDGLVFGAFALGAGGMVTHFWMAEYHGMAWAAGLTALALLPAAARALRALARSPLPGEVRLPVALAWINLLLAGALGVLLGVNRLEPFLPFAHLQGVYAHAHLAALGWATLMVMGVGYRVIPMLLPAAMPGGAAVYGATVLFEVGLLGLATSFVVGLAPGPWAVLTACGVFLFLGLVLRLRRHLRPPPGGLRRPDLGTLHVAQALVYLAVATALGVFLAFAPASEATLRVASVYGVCGLLGFLVQMVLGVQSRLLPLVAWLHGFAGGGYRELPPSLHEAPARPVQWLVFGAWSLGVPLVAGGIAGEAGAARSAGAVLLLLGVAGSAFNAALVVRRLKAERATGGEAAEASTATARGE
jgi:hypothetical protein